MHKSAAATLRYMSPVTIGSPFSHKFHTPPSTRICPRPTAITDRNSLGSTGKIIRKDKHLKHTSRVSPRMCLAKLDICKTLFSSRVQSSCPPEETNRLKLHDRDDHTGENEKKNNGTFVDFNSPTRNSVLDHGLDGLSTTKPCVLGRGGFGVVLVALRKGRKVAAKIITKRSTRRNSCEASLIGEENGLSLKHPNLVQILDIYGFREQHAVVLMEFAGNRNLNQIIDDPDELMEDKRRLKFAWQVACAVGWCHVNCVAHLDVKPANVMVNDHDWCKLGDFGCSRHLNHTSATFHLPGGTVAYRAPELLGYSGEPTVKADIYSLAVTMWQLLARRSPFAGLDTHTIIYKVVAQEARPADDVPQVQSKREYVKLYSEMWVQDPARRPHIDLVIEGIKQCQL